MALVSLVSVILAEVSCCWYTVPDGALIPPKVTVSAPVRLLFNKISEYPLLPLLKANDWMMLAPFMATVFISG